MPGLLQWTYDQEEENEASTVVETCRTEQFLHIEPQVSGVHHGGHCDPLWVYCLLLSLHLLQLLLQPVVISLLHLLLSLGLVHPSLHPAFCLSISTMSDWLACRILARLFFLQSDSGTCWWSLCTPAPHVHHVNPPGHSVQFMPSLRDISSLLLCVCLFQGRLCFRLHLGSCLR